MKNKVLIISLGSDIFVPPGTEISGGQAVFARNLASNLASEYDVTVMTLLFSMFRKSYRPKKFKVHELPLAISKIDAFSLWENFDSIKSKAIKILESFILDQYIVISIYWISGYVLLELPSFSPIKWFHSYASYGIQKINSVDYFDRSDYFKRRIEVEKEIAKCASYIWTISQYEKELIIKYFSLPVEKLLKLPRVVENKRFFFKSVKKSKLKWDIIFIGRLDIAKGVYDIPLILKHLRCQESYRIMIVGGSPKKILEYQKWFQMNFPSVYTKHKITFSCSINHEKIPDLIRKSATVLIPSHYELFGNVALEAISCGVPVVASRVGGLPELVKEDVFGLLFDLGNFSQAADCLEYLLKSPSSWVRFRNKIMNSCHFEYTWENLIPKIREVL